jgi:hypothetical protein
MRPEGHWGCVDPLKNDHNSYLKQLLWVPRTPGRWAPPALTRMSVENPGQRRWENRRWLRNAIERSTERANESVNV